MASLFTFKKEPDLATVQQAVFQAEMKAWQKNKRGPEPTLDAVIQRTRKFTPTGALMDYATRGRGDKKITSAPGAKEVLSSEEAERLTVALLEVESVQQKKGIKHPDLMVMGKDKQQYVLEPKEFGGWLQANAAAGAVVPVDEWVQGHNIGLTGHGSTLANGEDESLYIEIHDGQRRVVGHGEVSKPLEGYYGGVVGTKSADQDLLDIFVSTEAYDHMAAGEVYRGPVFVMQQRRKDDTELKVGFADNVDQFKRIMTSTWEDPSEFEQKSEGRYVELTYEQYQQMKAMLAKNPKMTLEQFAEQANLDLDEITREPQVSESNAKMERALANAGQEAVGEAEERSGPPPVPAKAKGNAPKGRLKPAAR